MKLLFPDSLLDVDQLSFSTFLYFNKGEVTTILHPTVSIFLTGCDPLHFVDLVEKESVLWKKQFFDLFNIWSQSNQALMNVTSQLEPLNDGFYNTILLSYSRTEDALKENDDLIKSTKLSQKELLSIINIPMACQELISHILFEKFLSYYNEILLSPAEIVNLSNKGNYETTRAKNIDYKELLNYCDTLFKGSSIEELLIKAYFLRLKARKHFPNILLSNPNISKFLDKLPVEYAPIIGEKPYYENIDVVGWEIFRQLTSGYIDNIDPNNRAKFVHKLLIENNDEVTNLRNKCQKLAEQYKGEQRIDQLPQNISQHIRINTEKEIKDLLKLDKKRFSETFDAIFADEKTWFAVGAFIISYFQGLPYITEGAAIAAVASFTGKSFKVATDTEKKIKNSDYSLIYRLHNLAK